jgi:hypothetical protein
MNAHKKPPENGGFFTHKTRTNVYLFCHDKHIQHTLKTQTCKEISQKNEIMEVYYFYIFLNVWSRRPNERNRLGVKRSDNYNGRTV